VKFFAARLARLARREREERVATLQEEARRIDIAHSVVTGLGSCHLTHQRGVTLALRAKRDALVRQMLELRRLAP
jgi:hypothetical protein